MPKKRRVYSRTKTRSLNSAELSYFDSDIFADVCNYRSPLTIAEMECCECILNRQDWFNLLKILKDNRKRLSLRERQCVYLFYWKKIDHLKIAKALKLRRSVVSIYLQRARTKIAAAMGYDLDNLLK